MGALRGRHDLWGCIPIALCEGRVSVGGAVLAQSETSVVLAHLKVAMGLGLAIFSHPHPNHLLEHCRSSQTDSSPAKTAPRGVGIYRFLPRRYEVISDENDGQNE